MDNRYLKGPSPIKRKTGLEGALIYKDSNLRILTGTSTEEGMPREAKVLPSQLFSPGHLVWHTRPAARSCSGMRQPSPVRSHYLQCLSPSSVEKLLPEFSRLPLQCLHCSPTSHPVPSFQNACSALGSTSHLETYI